MVREGEDGEWAQVLEARPGAAGAQAVTRARVLPGACVREVPRPWMVVSRRRRGRLVVAVAGEVGAEEMGEQRRRREEQRQLLEQQDRGRVGRLVRAAAAQREERRRFRQAIREVMRVGAEERRGRREAAEAMVAMAAGWGRLGKRRRDRVGKTHSMTGGDAGVDAAAQVAMDERVQAVATEEDDEDETLGALWRRVGPAMGKKRRVEARERKMEDTESSGDEEMTLEEMERRAAAREAVQNGESGEGREGEEWQGSGVPKMRDKSEGEV